MKLNIHVSNQKGLRWLLDQISTKGITINYQLYNSYDVLGRSNGTFKVIANLRYFAENKPVEIQIQKDLFLPQFTFLLELTVFHELLHLVLQWDNKSDPHDNTFWTLLEKLTKRIESRAIKELEAWYEFVENQRDFPAGLSRRQ